MNQKDIFQNMTKGEWTVRTDATKNGDTAVVIFTDNHTIEFTKVRPKFSQQFIADAIARAEAVNNTYGKEINPEAVSRLFDYALYEESFQIYGFFQVGNSRFEGFAAKHLLREMRKEALTAAKL